MGKVVRLSDRLRAIERRIWAREMLVREYRAQRDELVKAVRLVDECADALTEDGYAYLVDAAREALARAREREAPRGL